jgi:hypothetical protein
MVMIIFGTQRDIIRAVCFWTGRAPKKVKSLDAVTSIVDLETEFPNPEPEWERHDRTCDSKA